MKNNLSNFLCNVVLNSPLFNTAMGSLKLAIDLYSQCKNNADYAFSVVAMDHATTLVLLDRLKFKKGEILQRNGHMINFQESMNQLSNNKGVPISESIELNFIHNTRDGILHKGETVSKSESRYYIKKTLEFFDRFITKEYKQRLPKFFSSNINLYKENLQPNKIDTIKQFSSVKRTSIKNPIIVFAHNYELTYALINLLGVKNEVLKKGAQFNFKNLKNLKNLKFISSHDRKLFSQSMMIHEQISIGDLDQKIPEIKKLNNFLEKFATKLRKQSPNSLSKQFEDIDVGSLIKHLYRSESEQKRVKRNRGK